MVAGRRLELCPWVNPFSAVSQLSIALWISWMGIPLVFKTRILGAHLSGASFKVGGWSVTWGCSSLLLRENLLVSSSFPIGDHGRGAGVYGETESHPLLLVSVWVFFLISLMCRSCSARFLNFSHRRLSHWDCRNFTFSVSVGACKFRVFICHHLEPEPVNLTC